MTIYSQKSLSHWKQTLGCSCTDSYFNNGTKRESMAKPFSRKYFCHFVKCIPREQY